MKNKIWKNLKRRYREVNEKRISSLFDDKLRFEKFSAVGAGVFLDYSKTNIDDITKRLLLDLVEGFDIPERRYQMFSGKRINRSEDRSVLHVALRNLNDDLFIGDTNIKKQIRDTFVRMVTFSKGIRSGKIVSGTGEKFTDIINIGIGGSDLGPRMTITALNPYIDGPKCHFVSNLDGAEIHDVISELNPGTTLVIISSKTFTTAETMTNAKTAINWLSDKLGSRKKYHLIAISSSLEQTAKFDIDVDNVFSFGDWVGGRYSVWGPIGLSLMIAIGDKNFSDFLSGAKEMDDHFNNAETDLNLPILLAMVGVWHRNICNYSSRAILPYENRLSFLPAYLQQLDMESNGKSINQDGKKVANRTSPIVWGEPGTNGQHAFYQFLHQGTSVVPCEFLIGANGHEKYLSKQHELLILNCLAQSEALMKGDTAKISNPNLEFPGNRPSVTILYELLTPKVLGSLIAMFEHRTFVEGVIWDVNSFDQWGVELGKRLTNEFLPLIKSKGNFSDLNASTAGLLKKVFGSGIE